MAGGVKTIAGNLNLPESPQWRDGALWFVDGPCVKFLSRDGTVRTHAKTDSFFLIGLSFLPDGSALVCNVRDRHVLRISDKGKSEMFADLSRETPYLLNELTVMADGSIVVDDVGYDVLNGAEPKAAKLIRIAPDGTISRTGSPLFFGNGMFALDNGSALLVAESVKARIWRFNLIPGQGLDSGAVIANAEYGLDGLASAPDGTIWYANILSGHVVHLDRQGKEIERIATGFEHPTSCILNADGSKLYVTAMRDHPTATTLPTSGAILEIETGRRA